MSEKRLTKAQRVFLTFAAAETFADNSGRGTYIWGRHQMRTANTLQAHGLIHISPTFYATITPAGRAALHTEGEKA